MENMQHAVHASTLFAVAERMHAACAAYDLALPQISDVQLHRQLQNFADENHQHLSLLQQRLEVQDDRSALSQAASNAAVQAAAWLQTKQVQLGQLLGVQDLFVALAQREEALVQAYGNLRAHSALDEELDQLAKDQLDCARARQQWLADLGHVAPSGEGGPGQADNVTDEGRRGVTINTPKPASAENSDC